MAFRYAHLCAAVVMVCLLISCGGEPQADNPLRFVAAKGYNLLITLRPAHMWNSDLMQELLDEVSDETIDRVNADWEETFGTTIEESIYLFGGIRLPKSMSRTRIREAIFIGGGPYKDKKIREICNSLFRSEEYLEHEHNDATYYELSPPPDEDHTFAYAITDEATIIGLKKSVTDTLDVIDGREKSIWSDDEYRENSSLVTESAAITAVVWDVSHLLEIGTAFLRMQQRENLSSDTADAINSLEAMGMSAEFTNDLVLTFRGRFEDSEAAEMVSDYVLEALDNMKEGDGLRNLMIMFKGAAESEEDLIEVLDSTAVIVDGNVLTIEQTIPGQSPILYNIRDSFFGAMEAEPASELEHHPVEEETEIATLESETPPDISQLQEVNPADSEELQIQDISRSRPVMSDVTPEQTDTVARILRLSQAVQQYIVDHARVGAPKPKSIDELKAALNEYSSDVDDLLLDGWGNEMQYNTYSEVLGDRFYGITSLGSDGASGPEPPGLVDIQQPEHDISFQRSVFVRRVPGHDNRGNSFGPQWSMRSGTASRMLLLGWAIEDYIRDNPDIGSPKAKNITELLQLLPSMKSEDIDNFSRDGWGNLFVYEADMEAGSKKYELRSLGSDGKRGPEPAEPGVLERLEEDYIWRDGDWVQRH